MKEMCFRYIHAPVLKPIPIITKSGNWFQRVKGWFTTRKWQVEKDFYFNINNLPCFIPKGFIFDGASVPRPFWLLLHPTGILLIPGLIHDYGYKNMYLMGFRRSDIDDGYELAKYFTFEDRKHWDILFRKIAVAVNGFKIINRVAYLGVRAGGWRAFNKHRKCDYL